MAYYSLVRYIGDGSNRTFTVPFSYIAPIDVEVYVDGIEVTYTWLTTSTIQLTTAPALATTITVKRNTSKDSKLVDYNNGSILDEQALDLQTDQLMYIAQENADVATDSIVIGSDGAVDFTGRILRNVGDPVTATDVATKGYITNSLDAAVVTATSDAVAARDAAIVAKVAAELAEVNAETAEAGAVVAQGLAEDAKDAAEAAAAGVPTLPLNGATDLLNASITNAKLAFDGGRSPYAFYKSDFASVAFVKTGAAALSIKAGTFALVGDTNTMVSWSADTAVVIPTLTGGTDYAIYACTDGTCRADASFTAPTGYTTANSRLIGGFHYGLVAPGTTVAGGSFATTGDGMIWTQGDVDKIAGINEFSLWDLKWRTTSNDPTYRGQKGFAYSPDAGCWVAIYYVSTDHIANGLSKAGTNIASGTVLPKIPLAFGGNGTTTYAAPSWWDFNEIVLAYGCRMPFESQFVAGAFGVTENQSIDAVSSTYPTTQRNAGYTSKYGIEQASGHHYVWGADAAGTTSSAYIANGGRGQSYANGLVRPIFGGTRTGGVYSGSRCSYWGSYPWVVLWSVGVRAAADHLALV